MYVYYHSFYYHTITTVTIITPDHFFTVLPSVIVLKVVQTSDTATTTSTRRTTPSSTAPCPSVSSAVSKPSVICSGLFMGSRLSLSHQSDKCFSLRPLLFHAARSVLSYLIKCLTADGSTSSFIEPKLKKKLGHLNKRLGLAFQPFHFNISSCHFNLSCCCFASERRKIKCCCASPEQETSQIQ